MKNNDLQNMFLILAAAAAISSGKLADKRSMQDVNQASRVELIAQENFDQDQTALTAQKCKIIKEKVDKLFAKLNLQNLAEKSAKEQQKAAFKILKYVIYNTDDYASKMQQDTVNANQFDYEINLIYQLLCQGKAIDPKSQSITLNFLYQMCGLDSQSVTIEKDGYKLTKAGQKPIKLQHQIVLVNFADGQSICDPSYTKTMQGPALRQNWADAPFFSSQFYFEKINHGYQIVNEQNTTAFTTDLIKNTDNDDLSIDR